MNNKFAVAAVLTVGFLIGDSVAVSRANRKIRKTHQKHLTELADLRQRAHNAGWENALRSPSAVRAAYGRLFTDTPSFNLN
jgi:hypothetical protein